MRRDAFRPRLEALEERSVLSCTTSFAAGVLTITGDNLANNLEIVQNDTTNTMKVTCDGSVSNFTSSQVSKLNVDLLGGDDYLWYGLATGGTVKFNKDVQLKTGAGADEAWVEFRNGIGGSVLLQGSMNIDFRSGSEDDVLVAHFGPKHGGFLNFTARMGAGNDEASGMLWGDITGGADVLLDLRGGLGNDSLITWNSFDNKAYEYGSLDVVHDASLELRMTGGEGADTINVTYAGEMDGHFTLVVDAGDGSDKANAELYMVDGASGQVDAEVLGGNNNDNLTLEINEQAGSSVTLVNALLDGGPGWDYGTATSNVTRVNCEPLILINPDIFQWL